MGDLVVETSGSLNLPLTTSTGNFCSGLSGLIAPFLGLVCTGDSAASLSPVYSISGPDSFPGTGFLSPSSVSGIRTQLGGLYTSFVVDSTYISGTPIISNAIFSGKTLADIGLTPASGLLGTWTLASTGDTINVKVGTGVVPVPGPLPLVGVAAAFGFSRRLRHRLQRRQTQPKG